MAFILTEVHAVVVHAGGEWQAVLHRGGGEQSPPVWETCVWHCSMIARRSAALETTLKVELDVDFIPGGLQELADELPIRTPLTDAFDLDRQFRPLSLGHLPH